MFNSQKINNDPEPYVVRTIKYGDLRVPTEVFRGYWTEYDPRPEFDNNPNPILEWYRVDSEGLKTVAGTMEWFAVEEENPTEGVTPEHIEHARKVLERMVSVYGR